MFSAFSVRVNIAFFQLMLYATRLVALLPHLQNLAFAPLNVLISLDLTPAPACGNSDILTALNTGLTSVINILTGLGIAAGVIGIAVGGLMRATSFGNERRIAMSNTAITCAVIGLVIVILSLTIGNDLPQLLGTSGSCPVLPPVGAPK